MSEHKATIRWVYTTGEFLKGRYSREHTWTFDGGATVPASPAPSSVPKPYSNEKNVDPEEAYVASIASCHMLTFLHLAAKRGFCIDSYDDRAVGVMARNQAGRYAISSVTLRPDVRFSGARLPTPEDLEHLHQAAHEECYIANSVKTEVRVEPATPRIA